MATAVIHHDAERRLWLLAALSTSYVLHVDERDRLHCLHWGTRLPRDLSSPGSLAPRTLGGDSWKWLFLQPLMTSRE